MDHPIANNPHDGSTLFVLSFGAYLDHHVYVFSGAFDDALEIAAEWLKQEAPGLFSDEPDYKEAATELGLDLETEDDNEQERIREKAETDMTYTESGWLLSWEWTGREVIDADEVDAVTFRAAKEAIEGNTEVFHMDRSEFTDPDPASWMADRRADGLTANDCAGWYWWTCVPGCLPDSDAFGPHPSEAEAWKDAIRSYLG